MNKESVSQDDSGLMYEGQKWGSVPVSVFSMDVSMMARCLFALMWTYVNPHEQYTVYPSQQTLATQLGVSDRSIRKYMKELETAGCIKKYWRKHVDPEWTGNPKARLYELILPEPIGTITPDRNISSYPLGTTCSAPLGTMCSTEQTKEHTNQQTKVVVPYFDEAITETQKIRRNGKTIYDEEAYALAMLERGWKPSKVKPEKNYMVGLEDGF